MSDPFDLPSIRQQLSEPVKSLARLISFCINGLRPANGCPKLDRVKIVCLSDSHTLIPSTSIPHGDILIHAGDLTNKGTPTELQAQIDWLHSLPHQHKIAIAGNHDTYLDPKSRQTLPKNDREGLIDWKSITYLQDSSIVVKIPSSDGGERKISIYGSPHIPACGGPDFAFQYPKSDGRQVWDGVLPADVDVLVTHTPPKFHLDLTGGTALGDPWLLQEVRRVRPSVHVFGHVHAGKSDLLSRILNGQEVVTWDDGAERCFEKVMARQGSVGSLAKALDFQSWYYLVAMTWCGVCGVIKRRFSTGQSSSTIMVNASLMYRNTGKLLNRPQELIL